jgi:glycosyltransferase involved in cell wall biosynthesis
MIRRSEDLGLKDYINFTGLLQNEGLVKAVNSADFMVMFSNYENMPVVINEAFSCGVPVISSAVGGIPEFVNEERGVLVKVADEDDLLEKILWMLDHFGDFDKDKIRGYAVSNFSNEAVEGLLKRIYKSSLKNMKDLL